MKRFMLAPLIAAGLSGCAGFSFMSHGVPMGTLYVDSTTNEKVTDNAAKDRDKHGEACAASILGWVVTGDASVDKAMKDGKISKIAIVDAKYTNIIGFYATYCVEVYGE